MSKIQVLDQYTINHIAAGEVVERPSAVVKELVENAIDAKASAITVEIKSGGIDFIRVTDNGSGIDKEDIFNAFLRHSTSKIESADDLSSISSLGFRGEALSSISAVSQVELITKTSNSMIGTRYQIAGDKREEAEDIGCPNGTTILIRNLFFNTPARRKFLKSSTTEAGYINELMNRLAASKPNVSFKFINNNKVILHTSGNGNLKDIIYNIYGRDIAFNLIPVNVETEDISIDGYIANPSISRGNRNYENYFLNGRYIKSDIITKAIEEAYKPYTMNHKYPFTSLYIKMDPKSVDVNVHPTKLEVRFEEGNEIYDLIYNSIKNALTTKEHIRRIKLAEEKSRVKETKSVNKEAPEPFEVNRIRNTYLRETPKNQELSESAKETEIGKLREIVQDSSNIIKKQKNKNQEIEQYSFLSKEAIKEHRIIGQVFLTYWLVEYEEKLYIIDQHAAHEKVLYEKTIKDLKEKNILKQNLNPPIILTLSMREKEVVEKFKDEFSALGFEIEYFGGNEYAIREIPSDLDGLAQKDIFIELIDNLTDETYKQSSEVIIDKVASIACKAAVKGNQKLSTKEVHVLINSLLELENPYHCPHGRPTMILLSKYELEKRFKRVL